MRVGCDYSCGETHDHCADCCVIVSIDDRKRCSYGCGPDARCQDCALDHYDTHHKYAAENRPSWEQVP